MGVFYILHSRSINRFYVGSCMKIEERLFEHNTGKYSNAYTKRAKDWEIYLTIENLEFDVVRKIETHVKKMKSKKYIQNLKAHLDLQMKLVERFARAGSSR